MNPDFPSNSKKPPKDIEKVKLEPVVTGKVVQRKPPLGRRIRDTFIAGDSSSVGRYVIYNVLVPAFKDLAADLARETVERMLFGDGRSTTKRNSQPSRGYVNYNRPTTPPWDGSRVDDSRIRLSRQARTNHNFNEIVIQTRGEAEEVLDRLLELLDRYNQATVSDLYELTGIETNFTDEKYGWTDLRGASVTRIAGGYLLNLPRPEPLD